MSYLSRFFVHSSIYPSINSTFHYSLPPSFHPYIFSSFLSTILLISFPSFRPHNHQFLSSFFPFIQRFILHLLSLVIPLYTHLEPPPFPFYLISFSPSRPETASDPLSS